MRGFGRLSWVVLVLMHLLLVGVAGAEVIPGALVGDGKREVLFRYTPEDKAESVHLAGAFNDWSQTAQPLRDEDGDGSWEVTVALKAPASYEYKFIVDGSLWVLDPDNPAQSAETGFSNSLLNLTLEDPLSPSGAPASGGKVGRQAAYSPDADRVSLRIEYKTADAEEVFLVWGLDGWMKPAPEWIPPGSESKDLLTATPMQAIGAGIFTMEMELPKGSVADFVFHVTKPVEQWDNNGGEGVDFHAKMDRDNAISISKQGAQAPTNSKVSRGVGARGWLIACCLVGLGLIVVDGLHAMKQGGRRDCLARAGVAIWIGLFAFVLRYDHAVTASADLDEGEYVPIAMNFAEALRKGDIAAMVNEPRVTEHPRWGFVQFGVAVNLAGKDAAKDFDETMRAARVEAALLGGLTALLLALRFPIAGLCWSVFSISLHYTTMAYLDSSVAFFVVGCVMAFDEALRRVGMREPSPLGRPESWGGFPVGWLMVSSICAGLAMSSKYLAAVAPLSVTAGFVWWAWRARDKRLLAIFAAYVVVALIAMFASDPHLWTGDFAARIMGRLKFHHDFSTTGVVTTMHFPWWQPLTWLFVYQSMTGNSGWRWVDIGITVLGLASLWLFARRERFLFMAFMTTLVFLILWPTKWPQYETVLIPWLGVGADLLVREVVSRLTRLARRR